jgi:hypothetical protein
LASRDIIALAAAHAQSRETGGRHNSRLLNCPRNIVGAAEGSLEKSRSRVCARACVREREREREREGQLGEATFLPTSTFPSHRTHVCVRLAHLRGPRRWHTLIAMHEAHISHVLSAANSLLILPGSFCQSLLVEIISEPRHYSCATV